MKIRTRLAYLFFFLVVIFLSVFIAQKEYDRHRLIELLRSVQGEREYVFDRIISLREKPLQTLAYDYSFWDEMVTFAAAPTKKWSTDNLDPALNTYQANAVWVYNLDSQLVYSINDQGEEAGLKEIPVSRAALSSLFTHSPFCHFFVNTSQGLMEIYGATIHESDDLKREGAARGYLFCSRLWTKGYLDELEHLTSSTVTLLDTLENNLVGSRQDSVNFSRVLKGWDNQPVKYLVVLARSGAIVNAKKSAVQVTLLFLVFSVVVLLIFSFFIFYWVNIPLRSITLSLKKEDPAFLKKLKRQSTEFGDVSRMIDSFFAQKNEIVREISERKRTQDALNQINQCFASFVLDPERNIQLIVETAGKILGATCMLYNCSQDDMLITRAGWNVPVDFNRSTLGRGHICFEVIKNQVNQLLVIKDLKHSSYAKTDPNVSKYNLQCYISYPVSVKNKTLGNLCALFDYAAEISEYYLNLLRVLGKAVAIEEERKQMEETFRDQALKLDNALTEALKSREILLSMLEDNHSNKVKLEESVQDLAAAYSRLKESQEEVIQSAKFGAIGQLASSVAHEVRNPLATIMQSIEYLEDKVPAQQQEIIQLVMKNVKRANTIVGTLLDFSKAKELSLEPEDVNSILEDSLALTRYTNFNDKIKVVKELRDDLPKVLVDRQKIEQVFVNLFLNAIQAMPERGSLFVRTYLTEFNNLQEEIKNKIKDHSLLMKNAVIIEIKDEGVGISEENMKNIFHPFFTTKGEMMGIGLGLSVVKDILDLHHGCIEIESQVDKGTKVRVTLRAA